ncbi:hypothetical protein [Serratia liquefaciens]|uniref:hypothetical protein n=1 Tax=Serratia liquefaciens TaxID=614 RepID=UPI0004169EB9|nr:hypothetical protein [Serratia liquefaciens]HBL6727741.1 hypothetical protein [Serratia liquefaciens]HEJ7996202.1 hypothetical protein [Serratia liquefaciens]
MTSASISYKRSADTEDPVFLGKLVNLIGCRARHFVGLRLPVLNYCRIDPPPFTRNRVSH